MHGKGLDADGSIGWIRHPLGNMPPPANRWRPRAAQTAACALGVVRDAPCRWRLPTRVAREVYHCQRVSLPHL